MITNNTISTPSVEAQRTFSKELSKLRRNQQILTILVLLFVCMAFWIIVSLASSARSSKVSPEAKNLATPLTPTLDTTVFSELESRQAFTQEELADFPIFVILQDPRTQVQVIAPLGTTVAVPTRPTPRPAATTSSQLRTFVTSPSQPDTSENPSEESEAE